MPAARYWRVSGLEAYSKGELELSALHLYAGGASASDGAVVLLRGEGANSGTVFQNDAVGPSAVASGANVVTSTARSKYGSSSLLFSGSNLFFGSAGDASMAPGTQDFCIEGWFYDTIPNQRRAMFSNAAAGGAGYTISVFISTGNQFAIAVSAGGTQYQINPSFSAPSNTWYHFALVRSGITVTAYVNGNSIGSVSVGTGSVPAGTGRFGVGSAGDYNTATGGEYGVMWVGNIDDFRYSIGVARYTGNFTPPDAFSLTGGGDPEFAKVSLLLSADGENNSTTIIDNASSPKTVTAVGGAKLSTAQAKFGGASLFFDGSGDYLNVTPYTGADFGTGDFTIEFWAYKSANGTSGYDSVVHTYTGSSSAGGYNLELSSSRGFFLSGASVAIISYTTNPNDSTWHHWALTRSGNTFKMFRDGVVVATATSSVAMAAQQLRIGGNEYYTEWFNGYIDDLRITKGLARYTSDFTPPTSAHPTSLTGSVLVRADATAAISSSLPPLSGSLASLQDTDTSTIVSFSKPTAGFFINWDFGAGGDASVLAMRVGSSVNKDKFLAAADLQYSIDGKVWTQVVRKDRFSWPGPNAMTPEPTGGGFNIAEAVLFLRLTTDLTDTSPVARTMTAANGAALSSAQAYFGTQSLSLNGTNQYLTSPASSSLGFSASDDFTVSFWARKTTNGVSGYDGVVSTTTNGSGTDGWFVELSATRGLLMGGVGAVHFQVNLNPNDGVWTHWEVTRASGVLRAFKGGTKIYEGAHSTALPQNGLTIGAEYANGYPFAGFLQQVLIVKGKALHTSDFVPADLVAAATDTQSPLISTLRRPAQIAVSAAVEAFHTRNITGLRSEDILHGGLGRVYGTVKEKNTPVNTPLRRRVYLMDQRSRLVVRETWSDAVTGEFEFRFVKEGIKWFVYSLDHEGHYVSTSADNQESERMALP